MRRLAPAARFSWTAALLTLYATQAVILGGPRHRILVPADKAVAVEPPCQIQLLDVDGRRGLRISEGSGRGWCGEAGGSGTYRVYVPEDGQYTVWAMCLWGGPCTNACYVAIDGGKRVTLGNDPVYGIWHWVRGPRWTLAAGVHQLRVANHSDGIAVEAFMLLSDPVEHPASVRHVYYDVFYDDFDGCDGGNFGDWRTFGGTWGLRELVKKGDYSRRCLVGKCEHYAGGEWAQAVIGDQQWRACSVAWQWRMPTAGKAGIVFGRTGDGNVLRCEWENSLASAGGDDRFQMNVIEETGTASRILMRTQLTAWPCTQWQRWMLEQRDRELFLVIGEKEYGVGSISEQLGGPISLVVASGSELWIDSVVIRAKTAQGEQR